MVADLGDEGAEGGLLPVHITVDSVCDDIELSMTTRSVKSSSLFEPAAANVRRRGLDGAELTAPIIPPWKLSLFGSIPVDIRLSCA